MGLKIAEFHKFMGDPCTTLPSVAWLYQAGPHPTEDELCTFLGRGSSLLASLARPDQVDRIFLKVGITRFSWS